MKAKKLSVLTFIFSCLLVFQFSGAVCAETSGSMDLVQLLTSKLGVTDKQATGGAGSLFSMAKDSLSETDYGKVAEALPGISELIQSAPKVSDSTAGLSKKMGGVSAGSMTKAVESANKLKVVTDQFSKLGLDQSKVSQFIPIALEYANSKGGESVMNLLKGVWQ